MIHSFLNYSNFSFSQLPSFEIGFGGGAKAEGSHGAYVEGGHSKVNQLVTVNNELKKKTIGIRNKLPSLKYFSYSFLYRAAKSKLQDLLVEATRSVQ